jgi:succinoglycan biosynthesis protein ExoM
MTGAAHFRIAVCVCTYKRPEMLRRCLDAIGAMIVPDGCSIDLIVADNAGDCRAFVVSRGAIWLNVIERGISHARNAAVEEALKGGAHMIAFLDDDAWPEPRWLKRLLKAWRVTGAGVVQGVTQYEYPDPLPFWVYPRAFERHNITIVLNGKADACAKGGNMLIDARLFRELGMRYAPEHALTGADDAQFLHAAVVRHGVLVAERLDAVVHETAHRDRLTFLGIMRRSYQNGTSICMVLREFHGIWPVWKSIVSNGSLTIVNVLLLPLFILPGLGAFKRHIVRTFGTMATMAGTLATLMGWVFKPYMVTSGS